jgi:predicted nucleotidyltransferase
MVAPPYNRVGQVSNKIVLKEKLLKLFYEDLSKQYTVREIARILNESHSSVQHNLKQLKECGIINLENKWIDSFRNRYFKRDYYIRKILFSGLIEHLEKELAASAIILFGSFSKGESIKESDIDIFVECARDKKLDLKKYERKLEHKIELFLRPKITLLPKNLLNNVVNGVKLKGYFTIK